MTAKMYLSTLSNFLTIKSDILMKLASKKKRNDYLFIFTLAIIILLIYFLNLHGNYWITGWDNLHPEFNYTANIKRAAFASWQEYQGLGLPAGHGHATELSREILLYIIDLFSPSYLIRKLYIALTLLLGAIGIYQLVSGTLKSKYFFQQYIAFFCALLYLVHLATVQIYFLPYEAFLAHYGFYPWLLYALEKFLDKPSKKNSLFLLIVNFFASWQFYIPTLFFVYLLVICVISLIQITRKRNLNTLKILLKSIFIILTANLYWLLNFVYYIYNNINSQIESYLNYLYSQDTYIQNLMYGTIENTTLLKGYLFNYFDFSLDGNVSLLLANWSKHTQSTAFQLIGYTLFTISIVGVYYSIKKKRNLAYVILYVLFFSLLCIKTVPFDFLDRFLRSSALFNQVFRTPFTKFANSLLIFEIIMIAISLNFLIQGLLNKLPLIIDRRSIRIFLLLFPIVLLFIYSLPIWQGNLISKSMKQEIPKEYLELFDYFKTHNKNRGRIMNLPQFQADGWNQYAWGYNGSGFLWYGIEASILDRAFDVWNRSNEAYYWELSDAIYSKDYKKFDEIINKYHISWIIVDNNIRAYGSSKSLYITTINEILSHQSNIIKEKQFGQIEIYQVKSQSANIIGINGDLMNIQPFYDLAYHDEAYSDYKTYYSSTDAQIDVYYPFRTLFSGEKQENREFEIKEENERIIFSSVLPSVAKEVSLILPGKEPLVNYDSDYKQESYPIDVFFDDSLIHSTTTNFSTKPDSKIKLTVSVPKTFGKLSYHYSIEDIKKIESENCNRINKGVFFKNNINDYYIELESTHSNNCIMLPLDNLIHNSGYLIEFKSRNIKGKPLQFSIYNNTSKKNDIFTLLSSGENINKFILPPKSNDGIGYVMNLDNISLDDSTTINQFGEVNIYPIPFNFVKKIKIIYSKNKTNSYLSANYIDIGNSYFSYLINDFNADNLVLFQSYNEGWVAYSFSNPNIFNKIFPFVGGKKLLNHVKINNWANGWIVRSEERSVDEVASNSNIIIIFWPQYLQFIGYICIIAHSIYLLAKKHNP
ncbi:hypothetical protein KC726_04365 [Candidatus Woesebacteria bacterium]|nr:hypothetical protein [Candidatus Woesebacteria bacterium]